MPQLGKFLHGFGPRLMRQKIMIRWADPDGTLRWWEAIVKSFNSKTGKFRSARSDVHKHDNTYLLCYTS